VLYTHEKVQTFEDVWQVISRYEKRPLVEEYHKAAETGAQIQERYNRTAARLERIVAILSIIAICILQMKTIANRYPDRLAIGVALRNWIVAMCAIQRLQFPNQKTWLFRRICG